MRRRAGGHAATLLRRLQQRIQRAFPRREPALRISQHPRRKAEPARDSEPVRAAWGSFAKPEGGLEPLGVELQGAVHNARSLGRERFQGAEVGRGDRAGALRRQRAEGGARRNTARWALKVERSAAMD